MQNGEGIAVDDVMIGMIFDDIIYFKTDEGTRELFVAEKCKPFTFVKHKSGETVVTTWYALPDRLYDDPDELADWARAALGVAKAAEKKKRKAAPKKAAAVAKPDRKSPVKAKPRKAVARKPAKKAKKK